MTAPIENAYFTVMNDLASVLDQVLNGDKRPREKGFVVLMFDFGADKRLNYISNANREDVISTLKEMVAVFEGGAVGYSGTA